MAASGTGDEESAKHVLVLGSCDVGVGKFQIVSGLAKKLAKGFNLKGAVMDAADNGNPAVLQKVLGLDTRPTKCSKRRKSDTLGSRSKIRPHGNG